MQSFDWVNNVGNKEVGIWFNEGSGELLHKENAQVNLEDCFKAVMVVAPAAQNFGFNNHIQNQLHLLLMQVLIYVCRII